MISIENGDTPSWLVRARREIGVREIVGVKHSPRVLEYHAATHGRFKDDETAWCSSFVCWCLEGEGVRSTRSARAASYAEFGRASLLNPGAIILFGKHDPDAKGSGHVGFVNKHPDGEWVEVLSGNCNNAVRLKMYRWSQAVAVRWPEFP
jgi:uncharacterized protein (TIGR02594 family)